MSDRSTLALTGDLDADLEAVQVAGSRNEDVDALLRLHRPWVERIARARWRRFERAHSVVSVEDAESVVRVAVWGALVAYRWICPSKRCMQGGATWRARARADWDSHQAERHPGRPTRPANEVGRYVRITVVNAVKDECRTYYKAKRLSGGECPHPQELAVIDSARLYEFGDGVDAEVAFAVQDSPDVALQLAELRAEARAVLAPAANRMLDALLDGASEREACAMAQVDPETGRSTAVRARSFLRAFAEREWGQ